MSLSSLKQALDLLPRYRLASLPTPLEPAHNLSRELNIDLWIKRDDLTGLAFGGNKIRKLEYLIGDACQQQATMLLTTAAAQSNFCRAAAAAGCKAGLRVALLLRGSMDESQEGNLLLNRLLGAEVRFIDESDPYAETIFAYLLAWAEEERARGERPYLAYLHGGSRAGALATAAYVQAAIELEEQCHVAGIEPKHAYVAVGSGSTLAGLLLGVASLRGRLARARIVGVCVGALPPVVEPKVWEFLEATATLLGISPVAPEFALDGSQRGPGYGVATSAAVASIHRAARREALLLNPVYTGKAFAALLEDVARGVVGPGETVLFVNTGGEPLLLPNPRAEACCLQENTRSPSV